MVVLLMIGWVL